MNGMAPTHWYSDSFCARRVGAGGSYETVRKLTKTPWHRSRGIVVTVLSGRRQRRPYFRPFGQRRRVASVLARACFGRGGYVGWVDPGPARTSTVSFRDRRRL